MKLLQPIQAWICPSEFGITETDKLRIGVETTWRLLQKMINDAEFMLEERNAAGQTSEQQQIKVSSDKV